MFKKLVLIAVVLTALLATAGPAFASGVPATYYVNTAYTGTEVGTMSQPFNTTEEAVAKAQSQPYGAYIYTYSANGTWVYYAYIASVNPPYSGASISRTAQFALLGLASLILMAAGWFLMRRTRALPNLN
jgi:hypothetical protein